jgi:DHA1 family bicyclomycin/chloramphenicol resistance-like MFS transporter
MLEDSSGVTAIMSVSPTQRARPAGLPRAEFTVMVSMLMASTAISIDIMLPAFGRMRDDFGLAADSTQVGATVTAFFLGLAAAQLMYGPLADRWGRKPTLYLGLAIYVFGALASALAPSLGLLIVSRFVWGVGAAGPRVISLSVVRDIFEGDRMARAMSFIMAVFVLVPVIAPSIGAAILEFASWRVLFVVVAGFGVVLALWSLRLPETLDPANRMGAGPAALARAAKIVATSRLTIGYTVAMAFAFGAFVSYLSTSELIISEIYDRPSLFPVVFGATAAVMGAAMLTNAWFVGRFGLVPLVRSAFRLFIGLSIGLVVLGLAAAGVPPFGLFVVALAVTLGAYSVLSPNLNALAMQPMGPVAGMAAAVVGTLSLTGGSVFGFLLDQTYNGTVVPLSIGFVVYGTFGLVLTRWAGGASS